MQDLLPTPFMPKLLNSMATQAPTGFAWPSANLAFYMPVTFPAACVLAGMKFSAETAAGNYDIGFYDAAFNRLHSSGPIAQTVGVKTLAFSRAVSPGVLYYAALVNSSSGQVLRNGYGGAAARVFSRMGCLVQASAGTLPNPMVPTTFATFTQIPWIAFDIASP